jgi:PAS domain S-box-containing protein
LRTGGSTQHYAKVADEGDRVSDLHAPEPRRIIDDLADAVVATDRLCRVTVWSRPAETLFGWSEADALGRTLSDLGLAPEGSEGLLMTHRAFAGKPWDGTYPVSTKSGEVVYVRFRATPRWGDDGSVAGVALQCRNSLQPTEQHERSAARIALLSDAGTALGGSLNLSRTLKDLGGLFVPAFADHCIIDLYDEEGALRRLSTADAPGFEDPDAWLADGEVVDYPSGHLCAQAMSAGRSLLRHVSEDGMSEVAGTERIAAIYRRIGVKSMIAMPLPRSEQVSQLTDDYRSVSGVVTLLRSVTGTLYEQEDLDLVEAVGQRAGLALDNAWLYNHQVQTVETLQESLLPKDPPPRDGIRIGVQYRPSAKARVGGDFYDVVELSSGRVGLVIGDVQGRGAAAAVIMGQLRASLRAYALQDMEPVRLLGLMDEAVRHLGEELFVTCTYAVFDPFTKECRIANAGHPPPLWVRHVCKPAYEVPPNVPLGIGGFNFSEAVVTLKPGDSLLFYTDGVVERRDLPWDAAIERVNLTLGQLAGRGLGPQRLADALIDAIPGAAGDDAAVLVVQCTDDELPFTSYSLPPIATAVGDARRHTRDTLTAWEMHEDADLAELLVSELVTNALRHATEQRRSTPAHLWPDTQPSRRAKPNGQARIPMGLRRGSTSLWIEVHDFDVRLPRMAGPDSSAETGRGLVLVDALAKRWGARPTADGKVVWVELEPSRLTAAFRAAVAAGV